MKLAIRYYAALREQRGLSYEEIDTDARTPEDLYAQLQARHHFTLPVDLLKTAVNDEFAALDQLLRDGDVVTFIPPVAGG